MKESGFGIIGWKIANQRGYEGNVSVFVIKSNSGQKVKVSSFRYKEALTGVKPQ